MKMGSKYLQKKIKDLILTKYWIYIQILKKSEINIVYKIEI